jgi:hypothetical protein
MSELKSKKTDTPSTWRLISELNHQSVDSWMLPCIKTVFPTVNLEESRAFHAVSPATAMVLAYDNTPSVYVKGQYKRSQYFFPREM